MKIKKKLVLLNNKTKIFYSILWSATERFSVQGVQFILSFVIARQLSPNDYGLIAMLSIFMAIAQTFVDSGLSNALIQKQDRSDIDYSTIFYFNIITGVIIYLIISFSASSIASFYNQPLLRDVTIWVSLNIVISSFAVIQKTKLTIDLDFKRQALISFFAVIISGIIGVWMAYKGYGVWTLVVQSLLNNGINTLLLWRCTKWTPFFVFSINSFKELFGFGIKLLIGGLLHTLYTNFYSLIIGKVYSVNSLGLYNRAFTITQYPSTNITGLLTRVTYPIECQLQNDDELLQQQFFKFIKLTSFFVFPMMLGMAAIAEPLIKLVLTEKWISCVLYIQILSIAYMVDPVMRMTWDLLNAKKRSDYSLKSEVVKKFTAFFILFATIPFGLKVICWGLVMYSVCDLIIITQFTKRILPQITFFRLLKVLIPNLLISSITACVVYCIIQLFVSLWIQLILGIISGLFIYIFLSMIFNKSTLYQFFNVFLQ